MTTIDDNDVPALVAELHDLARRLEDVAQDLVAVGEDAIEAQEFAETARRLDARAGMLAVDLVLHEPGRFAACS